LSSLSPQRSSYLVKIRLPELKPKTNTLVSKRLYVLDIFGERLLDDADAELDGNYMQIHENDVSFILTEQDVEENKGNFTKGKIIKTLENIKRDKNIDFQFTVEGR
jgi:DNA polymerase III delta subunit